YVVHRCECPRKRVVSPQTDLARADDGDQVPQGFRIEHDRIDIYLFQIFRRLLQNLLRALLREHATSLIYSAVVAWKKAAAMRGADFQVRKLVERSFHDQVRKTNRGFQRISNDIGEDPIPLHAIFNAGGVGAILRMHKNQGLQLLSLGPEGVEL